MKDDSAPPFQNPKSKIQNQDKRFLWLIMAAVFVWGTLLALGAGIFGVNPQSGAIEYSPNVLRGLRAARRRGCVTAALTGTRTEKIKPLADFLLAVPSRDTQRIQEVHITLGHIYCDLIERHLFSK